MLATAALFWKFMSSYGSTFPYLQTTLQLLNTAMSVPVMFQHYLIALFILFTVSNCTLFPQL